MSEATNCPLGICIRRWVLSIKTTMAIVVCFAMASCGPRGPMAVAPNQKGLTLRVWAGGDCSAGAPVWEPSGGSIVFGSPNPEAPVGKSVCDLIRMNIDGTCRTQLTFGADYDGQPAVSPDGKTIAFISERTGASHVFLMDRDGGNVRQLTYGVEADFGPAFTGDGRQIYFTRRLREVGEADDVFSINVDGTGERRLTHFNEIGGLVAVSRDKGEIYYHRYSTSYPGRSGTYDLLKLRLRTRKSDRLLPPGMGGAGFSVSSDEQWIAFVSDPGAPFDSDLYVCTTGGKNLHRVTELHGYIEKADFSPDGNLLVFVAQLKSEASHRRGRGKIYIVSRDGKEIREIGSN